MIKYTEYTTSFKSFLELESNNVDLTNKKSTMELIHYISDFIKLKIQEKSTDTNSLYELNLIKKYVNICLQTEIIYGYNTFLKKSIENYLQNNIKINPEETTISYTNSFYETVLKLIHEIIE